MKRFTARCPACGHTEDVWLNDGAPFPECPVCSAATEYQPGTFGINTVKNVASHMAERAAEAQSSAVPVPSLSATEKGWLDKIGSKAREAIAEGKAPPPTESGGRGATTFRVFDERSPQIAAAVAAGRAARAATGEAPVEFLQRGIRSGAIGDVSRRAQ